MWCSITVSHSVPGIKTEIVGGNPLSELMVHPPLKRVLNNPRTRLHSRSHTQQPGGSGCHVNVKFPCTELYMVFMVRVPVFQSPAPVEERGAAHVQ